MKISQKDVRTANRGFLRNYIPSYSSLDTDDTVDAKAKDIITVSPNDKEAKAVVVRFITNMIIAVSDGEPDVETIRKMLGSLAGAASAAVTAGAGGVGMLVINGLDATGDVARAAQAIYATAQRTDSLQFIVPLQITRNGCKYGLTGRFVGSTLTTDSGAENEKANVEVDVRLETMRSPKKERKNEGTEQSLRFDLDPDVQDVLLTLGTVDSASTFQYALKTNGAVWHDTISAVKLDFVELVYAEKCPIGKEEPSRVPSKEGPRRPTRKR